MGKELMRGSSARVFVHLLRSVNYGLVGAGFASFFSTSYASSVAVIGELQDPRLKDVMIALKGNIKRQQEERQRRGGTKREELVVGDDKDEASSPVNRGRAGYTNYNGTVGPDEVEVARPDTVQMNSLTPSRNTVEGQTNTFPESGNEFLPVEREHKKLTNDEDEFSLLESEPKYPNDNGGILPDKSGPPQEPSGSAWERLRREAISASDDSSTKTMELGRVAAQTQQTSTESDFTFSSSEQERSYAREEAQREFDERVEQERAGGDLGLDGTGRRWR